MRPDRVLRAALRRWLAERYDFPEIPRALVRLRSQGFNPQVIFDVGAHRGDFARTCGEVWPHGQTLCFEPLPHMQDDLRNLARQRPSITVYETLLGPEEKPAVKLFAAETASSVLVEQAAPQQNSILCAQTTIDAIVARTKLQPDFIKIDVQGYELEVLKGATATLPRTQVVLAEVNLLDIHKDVPLLADIVGWLGARGFVAFDICGLTRRPRDRALWQADFIFVPTHSPLRENKNYY